MSDFILFVYGLVMQACIFVICLKYAGEYDHWFFQFGIVTVMASMFFTYCQECTVSVKAQQTALLGTFLFGFSAFIAMVIGLTML